MPELWLLTRRRGARMHMHVLVSRHRDGRFIGDIMRRFHLHLVHGSTSVPGKQRGGMAAQKRLLGLLRQGDHVAITPDGPRGPRRIAAPGVAQLAALAGVPVLPCAAQTTRRHVLPSWDRMVLPLPFGRGVIVVGAAIHVPEDDWASALPVIEAALTHAAERADALCGLRRAAHRPQRA